MALLHIYDSSDFTIRFTVGSRGSAHRLPIADGNKLEAALDFISGHFSQLLFETHGSPGTIYFGDVGIDAEFWRARRGRYNLVTTRNCRIYFNGCNVAEGKSGWQFLEAAAGAFISSGGGEVFGQTSAGIANPFNGHVVHLWGDTKRIYVDQNGRVVERFQQ